MARAHGRKVVVIAALCAVLMMLGAGPASAHATLIEAAPSDTSIVAVAPTEVTLRYDEAVGVELGAVKVLAPDGSRVDTGQVSLSVDGTKVIAPLNPDLPNGTYTILWRVLSEDTHSVFGAFTFSVGQPSATSAATAAQAAQEGARTAAEGLLAATRLILYVGLSLLLGGLAFVLVLWPAGAAAGGARRVLRIGWLAAALASVGGLFLQGPYAAGLPLVSVLDPALIGQVAGTRFGLAALSRVVLLAGFGWLLWRLRRLTRQALAGGSVVLGIGVLASTSIVGHSGAGALVGLALPIDVLHLAAICGWLGGLVMLTAVVLRRPADLADVLPRWSRYAAGLVSVIVLSGIFAAWREIREWGALTATDYGVLLLVKVGLVTGMVALAAVGRWWVHRRLLRGSVDGVGPVPPRPPAGSSGLAWAGPSRPTDPAAGSLLTGTRAHLQAGPAPISVRQLRLSVLFETLLAVIVLGVTSVLVGTPPAVETYAPVVTETAEVNGQLQVQMQVDPARAGLVTLRLNYLRGGITPADAVKVTARWTRLDGDDVVPVELARRSVGRYQIDRVVLPAAGHWQLAVATQTSDIDSYTTLFTILIR